MENVEASQISFDICFYISLDKIKTQQASACVLGVAKLHNEIIGLETNLAIAQEQRLQIILLVIMAIIVLISLSCLTLGRRYLCKLATDPLTGLSNELSVIAKIKKVKAPISEKINALALFDVTNFTAVNFEYGY